MEVITLILSIAAIVIAMYAINSGTKNTHKQILVQKHEEIYEIIFNLYYHYSSLKFLYGVYEHSQEEEVGYDKEKVKAFDEEYDKYYKQLSGRIDVLYEQTARLKVLGNSYINGDLKKDVLAYNDMMEKLLIASTQKMSMLKNMFYKEGFPDDLILYNFVEELEKKLLQEINFGGNSITKTELAEYRESVYKKKIGMK